MKKFLIIFLLFFLLLPALSVQAVGVSIKPQKLEIDSSVGREAVDEVLIDNISDEPAIYNVYPDDYFDNIQVSPNEFKLNPGESKLVEVKTKMWLNGQYNFDLSIVSRSLNSTSMSAAAGVKLPVVVRVVGIIFWTVIAFVLLVIIWLTWFVLNRRKK